MNWRWSPCEVCDWQGPLLPGAAGEMYELRRAWHRFGRAFAELTVIPMILWLDRVLARRREDTT